MYGGSVNFYPIRDMGKWVQSKCFYTFATEKKEGLRGAIKSPSCAPVTGYVSALCFNVLI